MNNQEYIAWLAGSISDALAAIDVKHDYEIMPQVGSYKYQPIQGRIRRPNLPKLSGILLSQANDLVPIQGYELFTISSLLTLIVRVSDIEKVFNAVSLYVMQKNGITDSYTAIEGNESHSYDVQFAFSAPTVANLMQRQGAGNSAEIRLFVTTVVSDYAVRGNDVNISIVYTKNSETVKERLQVLQGALQVIKSYKSNNVGNDEFVNNVPQSQAIQINVKVAYRKTPKLMELVQDQLTGALRKTYQIEYSDGAAFPHTSPKTLEVTAQITNSFAPGEISALDIVFCRYAEV